VKKLPLSGALNWIGGHVRGFYSAVGLFLLAGLLTTLLTFALLLFMAQVVAGGAIQSADESIVRSFGDLKSPGLDVLALIGAVIGSRMAAWVTIGVGTLFLLTTHHRYSAALLWVAIGGSVFLNAFLKEWFGRPRPAPERANIELLGWTFGYPDSFSFPSGHALLSTSIFFTLAYLVARLEGSRLARRLTFGAAFLMVGLVGLSRVYLGVHYLSDVIAGILAGLMWSTAAALGLEAIWYFSFRKPEVVQDEEDIEEAVPAPLAHDSSSPTPSPS
jgi:undecaprenyl-diphosphatase